MLTLNYTGGILTKLSDDSDKKEYKKSKIIVDNDNWLWYSWIVVASSDKQEPLTN